MAIFVNGAENGLAAGGDGTIVTTGNSAAAGENSYDTVDPNTGAITFSTAAARRGSYGFRVIGGSTSDVCRMNYVPASPGTQGVTRFYWKTGLMPSTTTGIFAWSNLADSARRVVLLVTATGALRVFDSTGAYVPCWAGAATTSTSVASVATWYRIEMSVDNSGGTGAGALVINVFDGTLDGASPIAGLSCSTTTGTFGNIQALDRASWGRVLASTNGITMDYDDVALATNSVAMFGSSGPPSVVWAHSVNIG